MKGAFCHEELVLAKCLSRIPTVYALVKRRSKVKYTKSCDSRSQPSSFIIVVVMRIMEILKVPVVILSMLNLDNM